MTGCNVKVAVVDDGESTHFAIHKMSCIVTYLSAIVTWVSCQYVDCSCGPLGLALQCRIVRSFVM